MKHNKNSFSFIFFPKKNLHLQFESGGTTKLKLYISYIRKKNKKKIMIDKIYFSR